MSESAPEGEAASTSGSEDNSSSAECPTCGDTFANRRGMKTHHSKIHGESLAHTIECEWCGVEFQRCKAVAEDNDHNFCGDDCRGEWLSETNAGEDNPRWRDYETSECKKCGESFEHKPYIDRTFCDIDCRNDYEHGSESNFWEGGKVTKECIECGDEFEIHPSHADQRKRCSNECARNTVELECEWCGSTFEEVASNAERRRCCSKECWGQLRASFPREEQPNYRDADTDYDYGPNWYSQRRKARKAVHYQCEICGRDERQLGQIPHMHHITKLRYYREKYDAPEWYERGNRLDNLIMLCEEHHKEWEGIPLRPQTD